MLQAHAAPVDEYMQYLPDGANLALMVQKVGASRAEHRLLITTENRWPCQPVP